MERSIECLKHLIALVTILLISITVSAQKPTIDWATIPSGTFTMGSPENEVSRGPNETQHQVTLRAFKMSKHEITVAQYKAFVEATGYLTDADKNAGGVYGSAIMAWKNMEYQAGVNWKCDIYGIPKPAAEYNHPVIHVSWNDAVAFAEWMGCRLPTESEWEYACRAGTTAPFHTGNNLTTLQANYNGSRPYNNNSTGVDRGKTMPVGSFSPNAWGLYDMHGNVWEWCSDWVGDYSTGAQTDPIGPASGSSRMARGGSWFAAEQACRSAARSDGSYPDRRFCFIGFRLVSP